MKFLLLFLLLAFSFGDTVHRVARINAYSVEAAEAFRQENYLAAISAYGYLLDSLHLSDDRMRLNLAHASFRSGREEQARHHYELLTRHPDKNLRSVAFLQLGTLHARKSKLNAALGLYRKALIAHPANQQARYNYELVKKHLLLHPQEDPQEDQDLPAPTDALPSPAPNGGDNPTTSSGHSGQGQSLPPGLGPQPGGERQNQGEENSRQPSPEGREQEQILGQEPGESLGSFSAPDAPNDPAGQQGTGGAEPVTEQDRRAQTIHQRLQQMNLSPEKARMLLEALRQAEVQHLQQLPRQPSKPKDKSKPDW